MYGSCIFCRWMVKNCKMSMASANSWFVVERGCKFTLFIGYFCIEKGHPIVFFIFCSKRYVDKRKILSNSENVLDVLMSLLK